MLTHCKLCKKSFDVVHMDISAIKGHAQGQGHIRVAGQINSDRIIRQFMKESAVAAHQTKWAGKKSQDHKAAHGLRQLMQRFADNQDGHVSLLIQLQLWFISHGLSDILWEHLPGCFRLMQYLVQIFLSCMFWLVSIFQRAAGWRY